MDYKDIIENIGKYHYVLVVGKKAGILGSNNNSSIAKKTAIKKIVEKKDKLENQFVVKLKIFQVSKKLLKQNDKSKIKTIGGPIQINIDFYQIKKQNLSKLKDFAKNNKLFITKKFLDKKEINNKIIKLIASATHNNKLNTELFVINIIDKLVKN
jgi:hypothetical protein